MLTLTQTNCKSGIKPKPEKKAQTRKLKNTNQKIKKCKPENQKTQTRKSKNTNQKSNQHKLKQNKKNPAKIFLFTESFHWILSY